jgi:hypothetical protein
MVVVVRALRCGEVVPQGRRAFIAIPHRLYVRDLLTRNEGEKEDVFYVAGNDTSVKTKEREMTVIGEKRKK